MHTRRRRWWLRKVRLWHQLFFWELVKELGMELDTVEPAAFLLHRLDLASLV